MRWPCGTPYLPENIRYHLALGTIRDSGYIICDMNHKLEMVDRKYSVIIRCKACHWTFGEGEVYYVRELFPMLRANWETYTDPCPGPEVSVLEIVE